MNDFFDWTYYLKKYKDLRNVNINSYYKALKHWNKYGRLKRYCNSKIDPEPFICHIYIIAPIKEGGSYKYIYDIINYLDRINKNYIIIKNLIEFSYMFDDFNNKDLLIVQNLYNTNIKFIDIEKCIIEKQINLILPIHDFYFIYSNENLNNINIHKEPKVIKINHNLLKIAKYVIFPSQFMLDNFVNIIGYNDNYKLIYHNDNLNYNNELYIPKILEYKINISIITNINQIKGYDYYIELCKINKYKNYTIYYYLFGNIINRDNLKKKHIYHEGIYNEDDIYEKVSNKNIHGLMFINSLPESYCYALTKGINMRLPILYTDMGAIGERLNNINNRFHIYNDINSFYNFIDYIIMNENTGIKNELDLDIKINKFYVELFNI